MPAVGDKIWNAFSLKSLFLQSPQINKWDPSSYISPSLECTSSSNSGRSSFSPFVSVSDALSIISWSSLSSNPIPRDLLLLDPAVPARVDPHPNPLFH